MCAPSPPPAPDYKGAAKEQGAANVDAARVQGKINNPNVINPYGTQTTTWEGDQPTLTQAFSPEQQSLFEQSNATKLALGQLSGQGAEALKGVVGKGVDFSGAPAAPGSATDTRSKVIDAMMGRINEDYGRATDEATSQMIAAGIRPGTKAYDDRMQLLQRGKNDAAQQAYLAGGQEMTRDFQTDTQRRKDAIAEMLSQRQVPLNEITALMSGSQVSNPFAMPTYAQNAQVQPAPVFGATQAAGNWAGDIYNAQTAQAGNLQSGLFGLGGAGLMAGGMAAKSDRRAKRNIRRIGTHPIGVGLYEFEYKPRFVAQWGAGRHIGVMAQEVLTVKPDAVSMDTDGYYLVHYGRL